MFPTFSALYLLLQPDRPKVQPDISSLRP